ncbi:MAG TPA: NADP-dependent oxidoreductase [Candidatus Limnocylindria bacterium]|nr:NADP-dependent oxidoreductase [Candidatus Limnocylindria bacterium]
MKAIYLEHKGGAESLVAGDLPRPDPEPGELLVKVHATAVTPTELQWYPTFSRPTGEPRPFPIVLSHEFSGVVEAVGPGVTAFTPGQEVYGLNEWFTNGAQAEYCVVAASAVARKPASLDHARAAVVPISALTAWQGLFEKTRLERGQRILIHGGAGGVGVFVVQLARGCGAHVIATASAGNLDFVHSLGADEVIDHRAARFEDAVADVDVVFDAVGGETLERSWSVLRPDGRIATIVGEAQASPAQRNRDAFMLVRADGLQLAQLAERIDAGELQVFLEKTFPLAQARDAYAYAQRGRRRGKVALQVVPPSL